MNKANLGPCRGLLDVAEGAYEPEELEAVEALFRASGLEEPAPWVVERAKRISRQRREAPARPSALRRLVATLIFDTRAQPRPLGVRAVENRVRRLLFQAEGVELDLEVLPSVDGLRLAGQVTVGGFEPSRGWLRLTGASSERKAALDEAGEFRMDTLLPGSYRLEVQLPDRVVEIPTLPV